MKVFISWSGEASHELALALKEWLENVIQSIEAWVSSEDIAKGHVWGEEVDKYLNDSDFGLICLTPDNAPSSWLNFEAGRLSVMVGDARKRVCPLLLGIRPADVRGPLSLFQNSSIERGEIWKVLLSMLEIAKRGRRASSAREPPPALHVSIQLASLRTILYGVTLLT